MRLGSMSSVVVAGLWRASLLSATAWGRSDNYATGLEASALNNARRTFNGTGNNVAHPEWGSVGQRQLRSVTGASYPDRISTPPGEDRPTPREVLSEVFLPTPPSSSTTSALFVGWGLLVGYDLFLNQNNASEPLDIACDNASITDGWCPRGSLSAPISFNRSQSEIDAEGDGARSPTNYATAYIDLDWLYGRDEKSAAALRTLDAGSLNLTTDGLPHLLPDGTWLVADQRPTKMPVTFALMTLLLREHNRCCNEMAPTWNADTDEDAYQVCRQWTIAVFQHISENEFSERLVGGSARYLGSAAYNFFYDEAIDNNTVNARRQTRRLSAMEIIVRSRYLFRMSGSYDSGTDAGVDAVFSTVANPAFYSALPSTVGLLDDNYNTIDEHGIELAAASADVAGLIERIDGIESIVRGAAYSRAQAVDVSFMAKAPPSSPLFSLPVEAIQRGRDHGIPSYNDVRQACGFSRVTSFEDVTSDDAVQERLADTYGDVELLDAYTGALAENEDGSGLFAGPLLRAVFLEQMYRAIVGDRHYHSQNSQNEDTKLSTLRGLILDNSLVSSIPPDTFTAAYTSMTSSTELKEVFLTDKFKIAWNGSEETDNALMHITISATGIDAQGMIAVGFGGDKMANTNDYVICVVSQNSANCTDHSGPEGYDVPPYDVEGARELEVVNVACDGEWTSVTFARWGLGNDDSDYRLTDDIALGNDTHVLYAWRAGEGIAMHPKSQRDSVLLNFADGTLTSTCVGSSDYYALHGALLLVAWLLVAPYGIYQARYRKGKTTLIGNLWWEVHEDCMVICAEALLPLAITAIFTTGGDHNSSHAKWGFYMIGAIVLQILTGWARARALSGKSNNFSRFHRANKHFHIYAGWFAYVSGLVQCYRGLQLVSGSEKLVFSAAEMNFALGSFDIVTKILFPIWLVLVPTFFIVLETRKQFTRYFRKGAANLCGVVELINEEFSDEALKKEVEDRLMPRTEELPLYTTHEFNAKILNGRSWVIVDGAVLDLGSFVKRHPGGARVLMNVMGTDVTSEIIGEDASIGNSGMTFNPHTHTDIALEIARSLVVGYIEEEDDMETDRSDDDEDGGVSSGGDLGFFNRSFLHARRMASQSGSDSESTDRRSSSRTPHRSRHFAGTPLGREKSTHPGRLASWAGHASSGDEAESRRSSEGRRRSSGRRPRSRRTGGGSGGSGSGSDSFAVDEQGRSFSSDGSTEGEHRRQLSVSDSKTKKAPAGIVPVGAAVTLSAKAAAIVNAESPPPTMPELPTTRPELPTTGQTNTGAEEKSDVVPSVPVDTSTFELSPPTPASLVPDRPRKRLSTRSISLNRPVELEHPVTMNTASSFSSKPAVTDKKPKANPVRRILGRIGSQLDARSVASGDESDARQGPQEDRPFKAMRRVWEKKNLLDFFHVCPLLLHEKMGDGGDRPVHKFVFACPGRAAAMVDAMEGVCHFRMRAAKEAGMTVVQRSYNAFAVRVQGEEGTERKVVPASETDEGELCIEMRIRLYPDGLMSSLLLQLIKNFDNPAVQLQGPFLRDRLIPPPAHRNVVMIAAGTGVNPMVQMIRDYINPDSRSHGVLPGAHSRLVLLWQNNEEGDLFCADELTTLQAKAKGLLEVTAILSGDKTRRNRPGNAFRRAKARLIKQGIKAGLVNRAEGATGDTDANGGGATDRASAPSGAGGSSEFKQEDEDNIGDELIRGGHLRRNRLARALSRVTEEDCMSRGSSIVNSTRTFGGRDLESGGGGSSFRSPMVLYEGAENGVDTGVDGGDGNKDVPWSPIRGGRMEGSADDSGRSTRAPNGGRQRRSDLQSVKEAVQSTSRLETARGPSIAARIADRSTNLWGEGGGDTGGGNGSATPVRRRGGEGRMIGSSPALNRQRASRNLSDASSDMSGGMSEGARAYSDSSGEEATRGGMRLMGPFRGASAGRGRWPKSVRKKESTGQANEGSGGSGGGKPARPALRRSRSPKVDVIAYSSGEETKSDATTVAGGGGRPLRSHSRGISKIPSARSAASTHSHSTARRTRHESSRNRSSLDKASEDVAGSSLDNSESGLQHTTLSTAVLEKAIGPEVMRAIASVKASDTASTTQEGSADAADGSRSALSTLVGTETTGGALQVVVSGPAGFVFYAEGLLAEMGIPPQAVVLLD